ncbi:efflux RND transporter permease subunit [Bacillus sp. CGMCC 1.16607]|uniref:efflux RND transporter permease subunit n=1 Tax=Bacillus sp. CGMCC 1.16607 TaxID=3351842 RepID=UPI003632AFD2
MSWFTKWSFKNKAAITIMSILILVMGVISYFTLPMEFLPSADNPQVTVIVMGQGTDSKTMENQVTLPLEESVAGVKGKKNIFSSTGDGFSKIDLFYESGISMKEAKQEVQEAIGSVQLPQNVSKPIIVQLNTSMIPISQIAVTFEEGLTPDNLDFAKRKIVPYFKDIKGVANVQSFGTANSYLSVKLDNAKMAVKQVSFQNVMTLLQGKNVAMAVGEKTIDGQSSNIKVIGTIDTLEKVKNLQVAPNVAIKDIATIDVKKPEGMLNRINGSDGLYLIVQKESHSNAVTISKKIKEAAKELTKKYDNTNVNVVISTADMVETSVKAMMKEVLLGALFATIVIMLFLRNIKSTFITIISIPLSLAFTLFLLSRSGVTLNILTLGGVAVAVGRLVDDSIVVIENIFRKMQKESFSIGMVIGATKEVGSAITASTLTTVAVFLPIGLVSGSLQDFLLPFALTVTYSLLTSLIVALTVVPLMSAGLLKNTKLPKHVTPKKFTKLLTWSLNHKAIVLGLAFIVFVGSIATYFIMPKGAVDSSSSDYVQITLDYPNNTPVDKVKSESLKLEKYVLEQKEVKEVVTQVGNSADNAQFGNIGSPTSGAVLAILKDKKDTNDFIKKLEKQETDFPDASFSVSGASLMGAGLPQITIDVLGDDLKLIEETANNIKDEINGIKGIETVETNQDEKKTVYSLVVDPAKAQADQVAQQVSVMLNQIPLGTVELDNQETKVLLEPMVDPKSPRDLENIHVMTPAGMVPVSNVASLQAEERPTNQFHKDGDPYIRVIATVDSKKLSEVSKEVNLAIFGNKQADKKGMELSDDVEVLIGGASAQQSSDFTDLFMTMLISVGIVFLIMVVTFKTIRAPIAILFSLPLAAIGAILGLLVSRIPVDITSLLGALMLIGVVVTNAIVLLDRVKQNEEKMIIRDALVEAAATRMRPIIMTAVATICAMLPLLFKKAETGSLVSQNLAVVVIGGLSVATLLTLIVIPVVYELLHFKKAKKQRQKKSPSSEISI